MFDDTLMGVITLVQDAEHPTSDVSILVDLQYADSSMSPTIHHKWHVHEYRLLPNEAYKGNDVCVTAGGHFNPFDGGSCTTDAADWSSCEMGDLSGGWPTSIVCWLVMGGGG
jgi:hypothetical protein